MTDRVEYVTADHATRDTLEAAMKAWVRYCLEQATEAAKVEVWDIRDEWHANANRARALLAVARSSRATLVMPGPKPKPEAQE
jgi:hypothetical protein